MAKNVVYSWRLSPETKAALEHEARGEGISLAGLLDKISADWLGRRRSENGEDSAEQQRLHLAAEKLFGAINGGDPQRSVRSREIIRAKLARHSGNRKTLSRARPQRAVRRRGTSEEPVPPTDLKSRRP
jgi:hypothetical protein